MITPEIIKETARKLRQNMTEAEKILWEKIRAKRL
jgi:very-short-patch-repair endonuclease